MGGATPCFMQSRVSPSGAILQKARPLISGLEPPMTCAVMKIIKPKQAALAQAEGELKVAQDELRTKQQALQKVRDQIHQLQSNYQASQRKLEDLTKQKETIEVQLDRAGKLVVGLADEAQRW